MRCTLFSPVVDRLALDSLRARLSDWSLELEGTLDHWHTARFTSPRGTLVLSPQEFTAPQDSFSKILLGTSGYFWRRNDLAETAKKDVLRFIGETRWLIGIVGTAERLEPSNDVFLDAALELAHRLGGRIFTGTEFIAR